MKAAYLVLSLFAFASTAVAAPAGKPDAVVQSTAAAAASPAGGKVKCTRERVTGSNRSVRICLTEEQARTMTAEEKAGLIHSQHRGVAQGEH
ncbi:MAG TPA: hypothetical protein VFE72_04345 [Lysobacter sp.]|nr:hypothetical protein [Lysobacter sp.]